MSDNEENSRELRDFLSEEFKESKFKPQRSNTRNSDRYSNNNVSYSILNAQNLLLYSY